MSILWEHRQTRGVRGRPSAAGRPAPGLYRHGPPAGTVRVLRRLPAIGAPWSTLMTLRRGGGTLFTVGGGVAGFGCVWGPRAPGGPPGGGGGVSFVAVVRGRVGGGRPAGGR